MMTNSFDPAGFTEYKYTGAYGVTDLKSLNPYGEWGDFRSAFPDITEQDFLDDPERYRTRIRIWNRNHIKFLKETDQFGKPYDVSVQVKHNPLWDNQVSPATDPLTSYKCVILDLSDDQK
jgi:hypothetical protein